VIPEIDNPGHTRSIGIDPEFREIMRCFDDNWSSTVTGAYRIRGMKTGVMDPSYQKTFDLLKGIFTDFNNYFTDDMIMLGGDEVITSCYS
jgi:hexosaminidase